MSAEKVQVWFKVDENADTLRKDLSIFQQHKGEFIVSFLLQHILF